jgi:hypothetical protein
VRVGPRCASLDPKAADPRSRSAGSKATDPPSRFVGRRGAPRPAKPIGAFAGAIAVAVATFFEVDALAAPLPEITVKRTPAAADCPTAAGLAAAVEAKMRRPALEPTESEEAPFAVQIDRNKKGYFARLQARGRLREIEDDGETCAGLEDALAITLAILLDAEAPRPPPPAEPELAPPSVVRVAPPPPPPSAPPTPNELPPPDPIPAKPPNLQLVGHLMITDGLTWPGALAFDVRGLLHLGRTWSLAVTFLDVPDSKKGTSGGFASVELVAASVGLCARALGKPIGPTLRLCGSGDLGTLTGIGSGFPVNDKQVKPWGAVELDANVVGPIVGPVLWTVRAGGLVPFSRETFAIQGISAPAFTAAPVGGFAGAGVGATIW